MRNICETLPIVFGKRNVRPLSPYCTRIVRCRNSSRATTVLAVYLMGVCVCVCMCGHRRIRSLLFA